MSGSPRVILAPPRELRSPGLITTIPQLTPPYCIHHCRERLECATSVMARTGHIHPPGKQRVGGGSGAATTSRLSTTPLPAFTTGAAGVSDSCDGSFLSYLPVRELGVGTKKNSNYNPSLRHKILNLQGGFPNTVKFV